MISKIIKPITSILILSSLALCQYKDGNRIVTLSTYYIKPLRTVENGSAEERREVLNEHAKKTVSYTHLTLPTILLV